MPHSATEAERHWWDSAHARHCGGIGALRLLRHPRELRLECLQMAVGVLAGDGLLMCLVEGTGRVLRVRSAGSDHMAARRYGCTFASRCDTIHTPRDSSLRCLGEIDGFGYGEFGREGGDAVESSCRSLPLLPCAKGPGGASTSAAAGSASFHLTSPLIVMPTNITTVSRYLVSHCRCRT
jgi:hypothetical protein